MTGAFEALIQYRNGLTYEGRKQMKNNEIERMSYNVGNPLTVLCHLEALKLFWY